MTAYTIARGSLAHTRELPALERAAGKRFIAIGMADVSEGEVTPLSILETRFEQQRLYVALAPTGKVAGFLIWSPKDGSAYIEEVSVHPDHAGHRLGGLLIDRLAADVRGRHKTLTLSTFRDVAWNAPYYASLGFTEMPHAEAGPEHDESWRHQAANGLDMTRRLFMTRAV